MRIVISGATGFLGRHTCRQLAAAGHELLCLSRGGALPAGLPPWTGGALPLVIARLRAVLPAAVPVALIGFLESIAIAKALGAQHGYESQPTTELRAVGLANLAGSLFGAFPVAGSFSRSAVASSAISS
jgi:SulP family sulfate permease